MKFFAAIIAVVVFVAAVRADVESEDDTFVHIGRSEDQNGKQYDVIGYDVLEFTGKWGEHEVKRIVEFPQVRIINHFLKIVQNSSKFLAINNINNNSFLFSLEKRL